MGSCTSKDNVVDAVGAVGAVGAVDSIVMAKDVYAPNLAYSYPTHNLEHEEKKEKDLRVIQYMYDSQDFQETYPNVDFSTFNPKSAAILADLAKDIDLEATTFPKNTNFFVNDRFFINGNDDMISVFDNSIPGCGPDSYVAKPKFIFQLIRWTHREMDTEFRCGKHSLRCLDALLAIRKVFVLV
jgi:hypothetical protein